MPPQEIQADIALTFQIATIIGAEPQGSFVELRPLHPDGTPGARSFVPVKDAELIPDLIAEQAPSLHCYLGAAPRIRERGRIEDVARCWTLWVDVDNPTALRRLAEFRPLPGLVIRTGSGGAHAYWGLREALEPSWAQRANRRLALAVGGDRNATDGARVLRAAASLNHKHDPPRPVICTRLQRGVWRDGGFDWREVAGGLADDPVYRKPPRIIRPLSSPGDADALVGAWLEKLQEVPEGERNTCLHWCACRVGEHESQIDAARAVDELRAVALETGLGETEVDRTIRSGLEKHGTAVA